MTAKPTVEDFVSVAGSLFKHQSVVHEIHVGERTSNPGCYVHVDTETGVNRLTYWESGDFTAESASLATDEISSRSGKVSSLAELTEALEKFASRLE